MNKKLKQIKQRWEKILAELGVRTDDGMRYCRNHSLYGEWPKSIPAGRVLAHNGVAHNQGFRCWTWPKENVPPGFAPCHCGSLNGLPHVADANARRTHGG